LSQLGFPNYSDLNQYALLSPCYLLERLALLRDHVFKPPPTSVSLEGPKNIVHIIFCHLYHTLFFINILVMLVALVT
jgi:hypothetical protein